MAVALTGEQTQRAFSKACDLFNEEVKARGYKAAGFRPGAKLPPAYLYQMFGEDRVKLMCGNLLSEEIQVRRSRSRSRCRSPGGWLLLYTVGVLCNVEWCIRQVWCSLIIFYKITSIAYNPMLTITLF